MSNIPLPTEQFAVGLLDPAAKKELADWRAFYAACSRKYGTPNRPFGEREYVALYEFQGGRCAICRKARGRDPRFPLMYAGRKTKPRRLGVDHNHMTTLVRGLLCTGSMSANTCNRLIGRYHLVELERAVTYLKEPPALEALAALYRQMRIVTVRNEDLL